MIAVLAGRHGAGKSYLARLLGTCGWSIRLKQAYLEQLHRTSGDPSDLITWYRKRYKEAGAREVTRELLAAGLLSNGSGPMVLDSIHNLEEWRVIKENVPLAILVSVIAPSDIRDSRNNRGDDALDKSRILYWHEDSIGGCLMAEVEWTFQGTVPDAVQVSNIF